MRSRGRYGFGVAASLAAFLVAGAADAQAPQAPGYVRIQGRDAPATTPEAAPSRALIDYREEMRRFVQSISTFARQQRRDFVVVARGGLELITKKDDLDETKVSPARAYMRSLDGVLQEGLFFGRAEFGKPPLPEVQENLLRLTQLAKKSGLKVLVADFAAATADVDASYRQNMERGYVSLAVPTGDLNLIELPRYPQRPVNENAANILGLASIKNFLYLGDAGPFGREDEFALKMHENNYDAIVVDPIHNRIPLSRQAVETLKYKKLGARRLVLAHVDVGTAGSDRYYWKPDWREGSPGWISAPMPGDPDRYFVAYWRPEWKSIVAGDANSFIYGVVVDQGFDGVVLYGLDAYRFFEGGLEAVQATQ